MLLRKQFLTKKLKEIESEKNEELKLQKKSILDNALYCFYYNQEVAQANREKLMKFH